MKKSVLTLIPSLYGGGAERFAADISERLACDYVHTIATYNIKEAKYKYWGRLKEIPLPQAKSLLGRCFRLYALYKEASRLKTIESPHVSISHMLVPNLINIITRRNEKVVCYIHGQWSFRLGSFTWLDRIFGYLYSKADAVLFVSKHVHNEYIRYHTESENQRVLYIGSRLADIRLKANESIAVQLPTSYFVYVAGFRPVKNHVLLLHTLAEYLKNSGQILVLVGDGPERGAIEKTIDELVLGGLVVLLGNLANPYPVVRSAIVSLMVSSSESFSLAVLESMALGTPIVTTFCGGPVELMSDGLNVAENELPVDTACGVVVPALGLNKDNMLVEQLERISKNNHFRASLATSAMVVANKFDIDNVSNDLVVELEGLLDEGN